MLTRSIRAAVALLAAGAAHAAPIAITNPSFEDPLQPAMGEIESLAPPGWTIHNPNAIASPASDFGVWWPVGFFDYAGGAADGLQVGFVYANGVVGAGELGFRQTLAATLQPNTRYSLEGFVGDPSDYSGAELAGFPGYRVELRAGAHEVGSDDDTPMVEQQLRPVRVTLPVGSVHPGLGQPLEIRLVNRNAEVGAEVDFDLFTLDATPGAIETYTFRAAHAGGSVEGLLVYDRDRSAATQNFGRDATLTITEATGDLASFAGFEWDAGFVNAAGTILTFNQGTGTGNLILLSFGQSLNLNAPLPYQAIQSSNSAVYLASQPVIAQGAPGASFTVPEPGASGVAAALAMLVAFARRRATP